MYQACSRHRDDPVSAQNRQQSLSSGSLHSAHSPQVPPFQCYLCSLNTLYIELVQPAAGGARGLGWL